MKYQNAKVLTSIDLGTRLYVPPASWKKAVGLLRTKKKSIERYIQKSRKDWDRRVPL